MKKSFFIQLYFVVLFAAVLIPSFIAPEVSRKAIEPFQEQLHRFYVSSSVEAFAELMNSSEPSMRAVLVEQLMSDFPYQIELLDFDTQKFDDEELVQLYRGNIVYHKLSHDLFRLLEDKKELIVIRNPDQAPPHKLSHAQREVMGTLALLQQSLRAQPPGLWGQIIKRKSEYFSYPLSLTSFDNLKLTDIERNILADGRILTRLSQHQVKYGSGVDYFYQRVAGSNQVISAGPISPFINDQIEQYRNSNLWLIAAFMALVLCLWLFPSWRSALDISNAAKRFGNGELSSRSQQYTASNLNKMTQIFNDMASKIQQLFVSNQALMLAMIKELRLPISKIKQSVESLEAGQPGCSQKQAIESTQIAIDELTKLTGNILFYAKTQQEPLSLQVESVAIYCWLEEQVEVAARELSVPDGKLVFEKENSHNLQVQFDADNFGRAIRGLLSYLVETGSRKVIVSCRLLHNNWLIELKNTISGDDELMKSWRTRTLDLIDDDSDKLGKRDHQIEELPYLIATKVVEAHQGKLEFSTDNHGYKIVSLSLPISCQQEAN